MDYFTDVNSTKPQKNKIKTLFKSGNELYRGYNTLYLDSNTKGSKYSGFIQEEFGKSK